MNRFNLTDTAMILIDHQVGTNAWKPAACVSSTQTPSLPNW